MTDPDLSIQNPQLQLFCPENAGFVGYAVGDWVVVGKGNHYLGGRILDWQKEGGVLVLEVPERYRLTPQGYVKEKGMTTYRIPVTSETTFSDADEAKVWGLQPLNPYVEALDKIVRITENNTQYCGKVARVDTHTLTLNPHICHNLAERPEISQKDLVLLHAKLSNPHTFNLTLEEVVQKLSQQV